MLNQKAALWCDKEVKNYDYKANPFSLIKADRVELEAILKRFDISPKEYPRLVELGCGVGRFVLNFANKGYMVTGTDTSKTSVEVLDKRAHYNKLSNKIHALYNDLSNPIRELNNTFDAGYIVATYHCISNKEEDQKRVVANFIKLIRPGGKLLIMEPNPLNPLYYIAYPLIYKDNCREGFNIVHSRKGKLTKLLKELGMKNIKVFHHSFLPTSLINRFSFEENINSFLCSISLLKNFSAFHFITATKK